MNAPGVRFVLDGAPVEVDGTGSLLDALREQLGVTSVKDGCSPQGQCGCCTVWVDGQPRVSCVTPVTRVRDREVTTVDGLPGAEAWAAAFAEHGASQCGFCTPGIIMRVAALDDEQRGSVDAVDRSLLAHVCRCTGWQPIVETVVEFDRSSPSNESSIVDVAAAEERARLEGGVEQAVGAEVALGRGGFSDDTAPPDALVALMSPSGEWVVGESLAEARERSGKVQGRRTTAPLMWPVEMPDGDWERRLQTTWVEPAYLEPDASWCEPGGTPMSSHGNGGAFGGKSSGDLGAVARRLSDEHGRPVRVLRSREDVVRDGPKRPPLAIGVRADGSGVVRAVRTAGLADAVATWFPSIEVEEVDVAGPTTSMALRGAVWAEIAAVLASVNDGPATVTHPDGGRATVSISDDGAISIEVACGVPLAPTILESYCIGAAHMALGWVRSEGLSVDDDGVPLDLTMRSFGVLRAVDTPRIDIRIVSESGPAVNGSDAVFAATAAAAWRALGLPPRWPATR